MMMDHALLVGVGKFESSEIDKLEYIESDVNDFEFVLCTHLNLNDTNISKLIDYQATKEEILSCAEDIIEKSENGDRIIVYFATHGRTIYDRPYLACYDAQNKDEKDNTGWLATEELLGKFVNRGLNVLAFLDCCQSNYCFAGRSIDSSEIETFSFEKCEDQYVAVFAAASKDGKAYPDCEKEHGCWTNYLLSALRGEEIGAFCANTRKITINSLQEFLHDSVVRRISELYGDKIQKPYIWGSYPKDLVIAEYSELEDTIMRIKEIYFGQISADEELRDHPDKRMMEDNFLDIDNVSGKIHDSHQYCVITGNKGTGKTYLGQYLATYRNSFYNSIKDISLNQLRDLTFTGKNGRVKGRFNSAWKYILLVYVSWYIFQNEMPGAEECLDVLALIYGDLLDNIVDVTGKLRPQILCKKQIKNQIKDNGTFKKYADENGILSIDQLIFILEDILNKYYTTEEIFLYVDGCDEQIRGEISDDLRDYLLDLLNIVNDMRNTLPHIRIIILFRKDVLYRIGAEANLNKILTSNTHSLSWLPNLNQDEKNTSLYRLIDKRIASSIPEERQDGEICLEKIIPAKMNRGKAWDWILEITTYTPRDIISFFNICQINASSEQLRFTENDLWSALRDYSDYLWREMCDIISGTILSNYTEKLEQLLDNIGNEHKATPSGKTSFSYSEFYREFVSIFKNLKINDEEMLKILYETGVMGIHLPSRTYWYFRENPIKFDYQIWKNSSFDIHKGLWKKFHIW